MEKAKYEGSAGRLLGLSAGGLVPYTSGSYSLLRLQRRQLYYHWGVCHKGKISRSQSG